jgi:fatty acid desaturase
VRPNFSSDPFFFGKYYIKNIVLYGLASVAILISKDFFAHYSVFWLLCLAPLFMTQFRFIIAGSVLLMGVAFTQYPELLSWPTIPIVALAICIGHLTTVLMHNGAHFNFKPRWLNRVMGELAALQQLSAGLIVFRYMHLMHHAYPDNPEKDPHPPKGYTFWQFLDNARLLVARRLESNYLEIWGDTKEARANWRKQAILLLTARFCKTLFIFSLLEPRWFVVAFLPSYIANVLLYAGFNYYTHAEQPDGSTELKDLKGTLYFDLCNRFLFGIMYHKTHHLYPRLFNPLKAAKADSGSGYADKALR